MSCKPETLNYLKKMFILYGKVIPKDMNRVFSYIDSVFEIGNPHYNELIMIPISSAAGIVYHAKDEGYLDFNDKDNHQEGSGSNIPTRQYTFTEKFIKEVMNGSSQSH